jgi:type 1 glutamine amidotransferase
MSATERGRTVNRLPLISRWTLAALLTSLLAPPAGAADPQQWLVFDGKEGPGKGKQIVLISGDEEYRSEEAMPQLAKILAKHHGFKCTVLFSINPRTGKIDPNVKDNIPGLEALKSADLMIIAARFRDLPDEQMQHVADYLDAGKPVIGMRTATHAFNIPKGRKFERYSFNFGKDEYKDGFGRQVLGETWVSHHGKHGSQSTRGVLAPDAKESPIARGIAEGSVWGPTDVYGVRDLPGAKPIFLGQVLSGMKPDDKPVDGKQNDPMMPVAWTRTHKAGDKEGRVFTTTMGAATDLVSEGTRRMIVNAVYWTLGLEDKIPPEGTNVALVGPFEPTKFGFGGFQKDKAPKDYVTGGEDLLVAAQ